MRPRRLLGCALHPARGGREPHHRRRRLAGAERVRRLDRHQLPCRHRAPPATGPLAQRQRRRPRPPRPEGPTKGGTIYVLTQAEQWNQVDPQRAYTGEDMAFFSATIYAVPDGLQALAGCDRGHVAHPGPGDRPRHRHRRRQDLEPSRCVTASPARTARRSPARTSTTASRGRSRPTSSTRARRTRSRTSTSRAMRTAPRPTRAPTQGPARICTTRPSRPATARRSPST